MSVCALVNAAYKVHLSRRFNCTLGQSPFAAMDARESKVRDDGRVAERQEFVLFKNVLTIHHR